MKNILIIVLLYVAPPWVAGVIFFIGLVSYYLLSTNNKPNTLHWSSELAKKRYPDLIREFGKPSILIKRPGGMAIWSGDKLLQSPYTELVLKDEAIPHCCPSPHYDFLTSAICVDIDKQEQLTAVLSLSKSIWYDQLTHKLYARCHFMGANVATLELATRMLLMDPDLLEAYYKDTEQVQKDYAANIMSTIKSMDPFELNFDNYIRLREQLKLNMSQLMFTPSQECITTECDNTLQYIGKIVG